ncbi:hypothetical protein [Paracoccus tibetensis]|uniref:Uncharacterized protein n=1 Tax=Paracoccus tibetensis TaxID=336292 RepID=A0A1G5BDR5_9RHOB|nr:hypothetical protein [Paracoccus tibetensis]SCX88257.1 hypothetical protein SAMN05660710_00102 [Paracoccus tibetensis]
MSIHDIPDEDLRRGNIACTILCQMDFATNPQRWWLGYGPLTAGGVLYKGTGDVIQISALELTYGMSAGMVRFSIPNASAEMVARCDNQEAEVNNRPCRIFYQLFSSVEEGDQHRGRLIGTPISMFVGRMRDMRSTSQNGAREIELEAYGRLSRQGKPPFGRWTDADQRRRYPGDTGLGLLPSLKDKAITWVPGG